MKSTCCEKEQEGKEEAINEQNQRRDNMEASWTEVILWQATNHLSRFHDCLELNDI